MSTDSYDDYAMSSTLTRRELNERVVEEYKKAKERQKQQFKEQKIEQRIKAIVEKYISEQTK